MSEKKGNPLITRLLEQLDGKDDIIKGLRKQLIGAEPKKEEEEEETETVQPIAPQKKKEPRPDF